MADELNHIPVLPNEVVELLDPQPGEVFVDCTAGLGGHAMLVAQKLGATGTIVLNDLDQGNLDRAKVNVAKVLCPDDPDSAKVHAICGNFADLPAKLKSMELKADMILADLGFASTQVDDPERGLSFRFSGPLDMRMDQSTRSRRPNWSIRSQKRIWRTSSGDMAKKNQLVGSHQNLLKPERLSRLQRLIGLLNLCVR